MKLETERLMITDFTPDMAYDVHVNSLDEETRRFVPDEVFETPEEAKQTVDYLMSCYGGTDGPFVYPVVRQADGANLGYVQLVPIEHGWEIGYHIAKRYTCQGYATEAVGAFMPYMVERLKLNRIYGICMAENTASRRVLEKCGFTLVFEGVGEYQGEQRPIAKYVFS